MTDARQTLHSDLSIIDDAGNQVAMLSLRDGIVSGSALPTVAVALETFKQNSGHINNWITRILADAEFSTAPGFLTLTAESKVEAMVVDDTEVKTEITIAGPVDRPLRFEARYTGATVLVSARPAFQVSWEDWRFFIRLVNLLIDLLDAWDAATAAQGA